MNEEKIPYFVHEGMMARQERTIRRLWILCIINKGLGVKSQFLFIVKKIDILR